MFLLFQKNKFSVKNLMLKIVSCILIWILFVYVIDSLFYGLQTKYKDVDIYDYCDFDIEVHGPLAEYYGDVIEGQDFIENDLKFANNEGTSISFNNKDFSASILSIAEENFDDLFRMFPEKFFVELDEALLYRKDVVLMSSSVVQQLGIHTGESISISEKNKVLAGMYEDSLVTVIGANVITFEDDFTGCYNKVLLQVSDIGVAKTYFQDKYFRHSGYIDYLIANEFHLQYLEKYGDNWMRKAIEEAEGNDSLIGPYKSDSIRFKNAQKIQAENSHKTEYTLDEDIAYSVVSIIAVFSICILESYKHAKENQQKIAILRMMGCSRHSISTFYFVRSFVLQTFLMLCGIIYKRYVVDRTTYISNTLIAQWIICFEIVIFIATLVSTAVSMRKLSDKALLFSLNEEGSVD